MIAFLGSGVNEAPGIYLGANAQTQKISTQEVDQILLQFTEAQLALCKLEARNDRTHEHLYVHLPDRTLVYDIAASKAVQAQVWFTLTTTVVGFQRYKAQNWVWCYDRWLVADPTSTTFGYAVTNISTHWGQTVRWEFGTLMLYNEANGAVIHELELIALTGSVALGSNPQIATSYSLDGQSWSQDRWITVGTTGNTHKRLVWWRQGFMRRFRVQRFRGTSQAHISMLRLEAQIEPLAY
jgi:hypothetical protein